MVHLTHLIVAHLVSVSFHLYFEFVKMFNFNQLFGEGTSAKSNFEKVKGIKQFVRMIINRRLEK